MSGLVEFAVHGRHVVIQKLDYTRHCERNEHRERYRYETNTARASAPHACFDIGIWLSHRSLKREAGESSERRL